MSSLVCRAISRTTKFLTQRNHVMNPPPQKMPCILTSKNINWARSGDPGSMRARSVDAIQTTFYLATFVNTPGESSRCVFWLPLFSFVLFNWQPEGMTWGGWQFLLPIGCHHISQDWRGRLQASQTRSCTVVAKSVQIGWRVLQTYNLSHFPSRIWES